MAFPEGTTWLDLATLGIAAGGFLIAVSGFALTVRRDRASRRIGVRLAVKLDAKYARPTVIQLWITNSEMRTVTVERVGFALSETTRYDRFAWNEDFVTEGLHSINRPALPVTLEPGTPAFRLSAPLYRIRNMWHRAIPRFVWCEDSYGAIHRHRLPDNIVAAIRATKRMKYGPLDAMGRKTLVEVEDDDRESAWQLAD